MATVVRSASSTKTKNKEKKMPQTIEICKNCGACACDDCKTEADKNGGKCRYCRKLLKIEKQTKGDDGWKVVNIKT